MIRWTLGSAAIRIVEEYIYMNHQRNRLAQLIDLLERVNFTTSRDGWIKQLPGKWRLLYHTGRQVGLTIREASPAVLIQDVMQTFTAAQETGSVSSSVDISFKVGWSPQAGKSRTSGSMRITASDIQLEEGRRLYQTDTEVIDQSPALERLLKREAESGGIKRRKWLGHFLPKDGPKWLPILRLNVEGFDISMQLATSPDVDTSRKIVREVRLQIPTEMFDISKLVCVTYVDSRLLILRGITGAALLFVRSPMRS